MKTKTREVHCHGCDGVMRLAVIPVTVTELDGKRTTFEGKDNAVWICAGCRLDKTKLKAARLAAGMPAKPENEGCEVDL